MKRMVLLCGILISFQGTFALENYSQRSYFGWAMGVNRSNYSDGTKLHSSLRILFRTPMLKNKIKVGAEILYNEIDSWNVPGQIAGPSAEDFYWSLQILNDLMIFNPNDGNLCFHSELGYGLGDDTFRSEKVGMKFVLSLKMVISYGYVDLYFSGSQTMEKDSIHMLASGIGVKLPWY